MPTGIYPRTKEHAENISKGVRKNLPSTAWKKGNKPPAPFLKGHIPWIKDKHHSKETKQKMSKAKMGSIPWNKGLKGAQKCSEETRKKMGKNNARYWLGKKRSSETLKKLAQARLKQSRSKEPTSIEKKLYQELKNRGLLFEKQKLINGKFVVDAYIPSLNLIIEADGDYWHSLDSVMRKDKSQNAYLTKCGFNLLRITETEINNGSFKKILTKGVISDIN